MTYIFPAIFLGILFLGAYATVTAPKVWQRVISLAVCALLVALIFWAVAPAMRYSYAVYYRKSVIGPTYELWGITATNLSLGNIDQASRDISHIRENWTRIGTDSAKYTAIDLLKEIREQQNGEQAGPAYPPQGVGSADP